jgi:hypothetical protein
MWVTLSTGQASTQVLVHPTGHIANWLRLSRWMGHYYHRLPFDRGYTHRAIRRAMTYFHG